MDEINIKKESNNEKQIRSKWEISLPVIQICLNIFTFFLTIISIDSLSSVYSPSLLGTSMPIVTLIVNIYFIIFSLNLFFKSQKGGEKYSILALIISLSISFVILYLLNGLGMFNSMFSANTVS